MGPSGVNLTRIEGVYSDCDINPTSSEIGPGGSVTAELTSRPTGKYEH